MSLRVYVSWYQRQDNLTYAEIADILRIFIKTVETQMSRSLKILAIYPDKYRLAYRKAVWLSRPSGFDWHGKLSNTFRTLIQEAICSNNNHSKLFKIIE